VVAVRPVRKSYAARDWGQIDRAGGDVQSGLWGLDAESGASAMEVDAAAPRATRVALPVLTRSSPTSAAKWRAVRPFVSLDDRDMRTVFCASAPSPRDSRHDKPCAVADPMRPSSTETAVNGRTRHDRNDL